MTTSVAVDDDLLVGREDRLAGRLGELPGHRRHTVARDRRVAQAQDDRLGVFQAVPDAGELERLGDGPLDALDLDEPGLGVASDRGPQSALHGHGSRHGRGGLRRRQAA